MRMAAKLRTVSQLPNLYKIFHIPPAITSMNMQLQLLIS